MASGTTSTASLQPLSVLCVGQRMMWMEGPSTYGCSCSSNWRLGLTCCSSAIPDPSNVRKEPVGGFPKCDIPMSHLAVVHPLPLAAAVLHRPTGPTERRMAAGLEPSMTGQRTCCSFRWMLICRVARTTARNCRY